MEEREKRTDWVTRIEQMDRRWIFCIMAVVTVIPLIWTIDLGLEPTSPVLAFHDVVEKLPPGRKYSSPTTGTRGARRSSRQRAAPSTHTWRRREYGSST